MVVSDEQVAAMRAMLSGDFDEHWRLAARLDQTTGWDEYATLLAAAFLEAVDRRFGKGYTPAEIIRFVADARASFDQSGDELDPRAAERLVRAVLGDGDVDDLDDQIRARAQTVLLSALITDEHLDEAGLDQFMNDARKLADRSLA